MPARRRGTAQDGDECAHQVPQQLLDDPAPLDAARALRHRSLPPVWLRLHPPERAAVPPHLARIALELETRFKAPPISEIKAGKGLCSGKGTAWTVTGNESAPPWRQAVAACAQCPLLAQCATELERRLSNGEKISDQILAGRLFSTQAPRSISRGGSTSTQTGAGG